MPGLSLTSIALIPDKGITMKQEQIRKDLQSAATEIQDDLCVNKQISKDIFAIKSGNKIIFSITRNSNTNDIIDTPG